MKKTLITIMVLPLLFSCKTIIETFQTNDKEKIGIKSNRFRGTIFTTSYQKDKLFIATADSTNRFTPVQEEIAFAESILKKQIEKANKPHVNQFGKRQDINKNLNKYFRQYVGLINERGDRIIYINLHWDRFSLIDRIRGYWDDRLDYTSDFSVVFDGGSHYWSISVNLKTKSLYGLLINGVS